MCTVFDILDARAGDERICLRAVRLGVDFGGARQKTTLPSEAAA